MKQGADLKVLYVSAEVAPLAKVGGLADVAGSLPRALMRLGCDIRVLMPRYGLIEAGGLAPLMPEFPVPGFGAGEAASVRKTELRGGVPLYLVESPKYFGGPTVYDGERDLQRYFFFCRAVIEMLSRLDWQPDIVHCQDWHTSVIPLLLKDSGSRAASVLTIHNLAYQGRFDSSFAAATGLAGAVGRHQPAGVPAPSNLMGLGILHAGAITTVSPTYAREILTPEYGEKLDGLLHLREDSLSGILNGIDYDGFNPAQDPMISRKYDAGTAAHGKRHNKEALQRLRHFAVDGDIPVVGMVTRLDEQKGLDLLDKTIPRILAGQRLQMVVLGKGREHYEERLEELAEEFPQRLSFNVTFDDPLAHQIYAGADIFLMPSRFEPCGLGQMIALHYGTVPVVRRTGGLADTVRDVGLDPATGNGFVFGPYEPDALLDAVNRALHVFTNDQRLWTRLVQRGMTADLSWSHSAGKYLELYRKVIGRN